MNDPAQYSYAGGHLRDAANAAQWAVTPGQRIGAPLRRRRGRIIRRGLIVLSLAGLGVIHYHDRSALPEWSAAAYGGLQPLIKRAFERRPEIATASADAVPGRLPWQAANSDGDAQPSLPQPAAPAAAAGPDSGGIISAVSPIEPPGVIETPDAPGAPVVIAALAPIKAIETPAAANPPAEDPAHVRARRAGLHPDLSYVLLAQMSEADFKNASIAIKKAVAGTADDATLIWPDAAKKKKATSGAKAVGASPAIFKIHFVSGARPGCRRYVVTIEKNRWMTTALPLERCGAEAAAFTERAAQRRKTTEARRREARVSDAKPSP